jgi:murein DD-endopeptidase MepM/ murein hydrolase activator NlpD
MAIEFNRLSQLRSQLKEGQKKRNRRVLLWGGILFVLSLPVALFLLPSKPSPPPPPSTEPVLQTTEDSEFQTIEGKVEEKGTLFKSLSEKKVPIQWIDLVVSKLKPLINFKKSKGGTYRLVSNGKGELVKFTYETGPTEVYEINKGADGYTAQKIDVPVNAVLVKVVGEIRSSLFEAMDAAGEQDLLAVEFADVLAWEVDFYKDVKGGDRFKILVEKIYKGKEFIRYGLIHAVEYQGAEKAIKGIRYQDDFYDEKGNSLKKAFLKAPLRFNRISSRFSLARRHPILGGLRPHLGTDYAAPMGTPVWAVGDGVVGSCGWNGGYGNQVVLRHMNGYMTYYGHLSRIGPGIRAGVRVKQKQIVGYVGSTGLSTGPHLDYRLAKDGKFRNPLRESSPAGAPIAQKEWETFQEVRDDMVNRLQGDASAHSLRNPSLSEKESSKTDGTTAGGALSK